MSKANVSINALNNFKISIEDFNNELKNLETGLSDFESCLNSIKDEKQKFDDKEIEIQKSIRSIDGKISIIEKEIKEIEKELSNLYRKLSTVKPRIKVKYTRRVGTNSEGQPIYSTYVVEEPNPEYVAIQNQINQVRSKLKEKKEKLNKGKEIKQKLDDSYKELKLIVEILEVSKIQLENNKEKIQTIANNNMNASTSAIETLNKAEEILNKYLDESLVLNSNISMLNYQILYTPKWRKFDFDNEIYKDLKHVNPNYNSGIEWQVNCQRCVPTYEMRKRGYDVTALPKIDQFDYLAYHPFDVWENPNIIKTSSSGIDEIKEYMSKYGDGARCQIVVVWKSYNSGHTFIAEQRDGKTYFIDPQTNKNDVSFYFNLAREGYTRFCRIDNLEPSECIIKCCKETNDD